MNNSSGANESGSDSFASKTLTSEVLSSPVSSANMAHCGGPRWGSARSTAAAPPGFPGYGIFEEDGYAQRTTFPNLPRQTAASNTRTSGERTPARVATKFSDKPVNLDDLSSFYDRDRLPSAESCRHDPLGERRTQERELDGWRPSMLPCLGNTKLCAPPRSRRPAPSPAPRRGRAPKGGRTERREKTL